MISEVNSSSLEDISAFCPAAVAAKLRARLLEPRSLP